MNNQHHSDNDDEQFTPDAIDQQIDSLLAPHAPLQRQHADARVLHDLAALYRQDVASLEHIWERLSEHSAFADAHSQGEEAQRFQIDGRTSEKTLDHENTLQGQWDGSGSIQRNAEQRKRSTIVRVLSSLAAVIIVGALVGSWVLVTHLAVHHQTTQTKPAVATKKPVEPLGTIQMLNTTIGWAVAAANNRVLRTTDGGASWRDVTPPYAYSAQAAGVVEDFLSASLAWVAIAPANGTPPIQVFRTTDGGQTWQSSLVPSDNLGQLTFLNAQDGWILAGIEAAAGPKAVDVFRTTDGGKTWTKVSTASPTYTSPGALSPGAEWLTFLDASTGWATGSSPVTQFVWLYVTHDGGSTWNHQTLPPPAHGQGDLFTGPITFFNSQDGVLPTCFSAGADIYTDIYVTHDGGTTWNSTSLLPFSTCAVAAFVGASDFIDSTHGWVLDTAWTPAATTTSLYMTSDGGAHWRKLSTSTNFHDIQELDFVSDTVGWAIGAVTSEASFLLKTKDGGRTWT
jgi:photosystem II stability/assembly factor-like uncharacterized protein